MKLVVLLIACLDMCLSKACATDMKTAVPNTNAIQLPQKQEMVYTDPGQQTYIPLQIMPKPVFLPQQPTMVIIAQPAYVPQNLLYGNPPIAQQLLNYFHSNPQARYQLMYGGLPPHPTPQPYITQNQLGSSSIPSYQFLPNPLLNNFNQILPSYGQVGQVGQVGQFNQVPVSLPAPIRSVPPIITGFENFTPEQQAQIKAQLSAHLGTPLATTAPMPSTTQETQMSNQEKSTQTNSGFTPSLMYRSQYTKG